jgi:YD repeat-containing protein
LQAKIFRLYGTANAVSWNYSYDSLLGLDLTSVTDPLGRTTTYSYDSGHHLTRIQDALGHNTDMTYTAMGQLASVTRYHGTTPLTTTLTYADGDLAAIADPLGRSTQFQVDAAGRVVRIADPLGRITRNEYDGLGRLTAATDPEGNVVHYGYDANGNLTDFTDARINVTLWTYDVRNRPPAPDVRIVRCITHATLRTTRCMIPR